MTLAWCTPSASSSTVETECESMERYLIALLVALIAAALVVHIIARVAM
jgi:hypothetical protein